MEKEAPALIFGVRQFHKYLVGRQFTLVTDHRPVLRMLGPHVGVPTLAATRLQRWALILSAYGYEIQYKPGIETKEADLLSRLSIPVDVILTQMNRRLMWINVMHYQSLQQSLQKKCREIKS